VKTKCDSSGMILPFEIKNGLYEGTHDYRKDKIVLRYLLPLEKRGYNYFFAILFDIGGSEIF
jgi:hypothetical protein